MPCALVSYRTAPSITTATRDRALDDRRDIGVDREERQVHPHGAQDEDGKDRAEEATAPASQHDAAQHDGGNRGEEIGDRESARRCRCPC